MKKAFKIFILTIIIIISIAIILFVGFVLYEYFSPTEVQKLEESIKQKTGLTEINSIEQIESKLIPLSKQLIIEKYPSFSNRSVGGIYVLDSEDFKAAVKKESADPDMSTEESKQLAVSDDKLEGTTFCPDSKVYLKYVGNELSVASYLHHTVHETLHGLTCDTVTGTNKSLPSVWEESLTDYFTSNIITDYTKINADVGTAFPYQIEIVRLLEKVVTEDQLLKVYLTKDENLLKALIESKSGEGSYKALYSDSNIVYREVVYDENGNNTNPRVDEALSRIKIQLQTDK